VLETFVAIVCAGDICSNCLCWTKQQPSYLTVMQQMFIFSVHETTIVFQRFSSYVVCRKVLGVTNCLDSRLNIRR